MKSLSDIVDNIHTNTQIEISKQNLTTLVSHVFAEVGDALASGEDVRVHNFGIFSINKRPARPGRNPATGETIEIAASNQVKFKASKALKDKVA